jgi:hypothetical protein
MSDTTKNSEADATSSIARRKKWKVNASLIAVVLCFAGWVVYSKVREAQFLRELDCLVSVTTSLIAFPGPKQELAIQRRADNLGIDLFSTYKANLNKGRRLALAWMLITNESEDYFRHALANVESVSWPEVRIWVSRYRDESLSNEYRAKLLDLVITSPTSEGKLASARYYEMEGRFAESEAAYFDAMKGGAFWDALDAAEKLLASERYRQEAATFLLELVRDVEPFPDQAAYILLNHHGGREQLETLLKACHKEPPGGPNRTALLNRLKRQIAGDSAIHP